MRRIVRIWTEYEKRRVKTKWHGLVNTVMNLWVSAKARNFLTKWLGAYQDEPFCIEMLLFIFSWGVTESTWYCGYCLAFCTSSRWEAMVIVKQIDGMQIGRGTRSTRRKPAPLPLCPPQIPHDLTWVRTRAAAVGSRRLTAWAMARPPYQVSEWVGTWGVLSQTLLRNYRNIFPVCT
jgi:hypothetical protein